MKVRDLAAPMRVGLEAGPFVPQCPIKGALKVY